jgi:hypothetical protein
VRYALVLALLLGSTSMLATPAGAKKGPSCARIRAALASGQSADDVAKDMKVPAATVQHCSTTKAKPASHRTAKNAATNPSTK